MADQQNPALSDQDQLAADVAANMPQQNKIAQFKAQYPAYKDVPDVQLADALHEKYYSDMPRDAYLNELGLSDAGGALSTGMDRNAYQQRFLADNPQANQGAVDAVMAQFDQQAGASAKAAADKKAARAGMSAEQLVTDDFNSRLNERLQGKQKKSMVQVPQLPGNQQPTMPHIQTPNQRLMEELRYEQAAADGQDPAPLPLSNVSPADQQALLTARPGGPGTILTNLTTGALSTTAGIGGAFGSMFGAKDFAADMDKVKAAAGQVSQLNGGDTITGKAANLVGSISPMIAGGAAEGLSKVAGLTVEVASNAGLFGVPAFRDSYNAQIAQGRPQSVALEHAALAAGMNTVLPMLMPKGGEKLLGALGGADLAGLAGAGAQLGKAAAEGAGFSAVSSASDKAIDVANGIQTAAPWIDPKDMAANALGFGALGVGHMAASIGMHALDSARQAAQQQALLAEIGKAGTVDDAIAAASAAVSAPAGGSVDQLLQNIRPLDAGPMTWADATGQPAPAATGADQVQIGQRYDRITNPDGTTGFAPAPADPIAPEGGTPAELGAQYVRVTKADGTTGFVQVDDATAAPGGAPALVGGVYSRVQHPDGRTGFTLTGGFDPKVWRRGDDPTIPTLTDRVDHLRTDIPTLTDQLAGPDGIPTLTDEVPGQAPIPTLTDELTRATGDNWHTFPRESGTLGIPRAEMPQIKAEHRGALVNFLNARGIPHEHVEVPADSLKPTQAEFSMDKLQQAKEHQGGDRSILVSSDGHVLDGHHQWLGDVEEGDTTKAIRLGAPIRKLIDTVREFPSATTSEGAPGNGLESKAVDPHAGKHFPTEGEARGYLANQGIADTHTVKNTGRDRYDIVSKDSMPKPSTLAEARDKHQRQDDAVAQALANIEARKAAKAEPGTWQATEFAPRIEKMLADMRANGAEDMAKAIEWGVSTEAKHGQLTEKTVAFREQKARQAIADAARDGGKIVRPDIQPMTADRMHEVADTAAALPKKILEAAAQRWNEVAPKLADLGYQHGEVHANAPEAARELQGKLKDIIQSLLALAPRRYLADRDSRKGPPANEKEAKRRKASAEHLKRAEKFASEVLGINTRRHPGVDTSNPITLGGGISDPIVRSQIAKQQAEKMRQRLRESNPFLAFLANHGISPKDRADLGVENGHKGNRMVQGYGPVIRKTGKRLDELALLAQEAGFLTQHDIENPGDTGGTRKLAEMIQRALTSKDAIAVPGMLERDAPNADERLDAEAQSLGIDTAGKTSDQLYDEVSAAHREQEEHRADIGTDSVDHQALIEEYADQVHAVDLHDAQLDDITLDGGKSFDNLTDEQIDEIFGIKKAAGTEADRGQAEGDAAGSARPGAEGTAEPGEGADLLSSYSRGDVLERQDADQAHAKGIEAERQRLEAMRKRELDEKDIRARQDASADNFQLGQDAHDSLAGQGSIFDAPASESGKTASKVTETALESGKSASESGKTVPGRRFKFGTKGDALDMIEKVNQEWRRLQNEHGAWFTGDGPKRKLRLDAPEDVRKEYADYRSTRKAAENAYDSPDFRISTTLHAGMLKDLIEQHQGTPLATDPARMAALRERTDRQPPVDLYYHHGEDGPLSKLNVEGENGAERIALAAEQGKPIDVTIDNADIDRMYDQLPLAPMTEKNAQRLAEGKLGWQPAHELGYMSKARAQRVRSELERDNPGNEYQVSGAGRLSEIEVRKRSSGTGELTPIQKHMADTKADNSIAAQLLKQDPKVFAQPRIHQYDPEKARPLLLIACAEKKLAGAHPAVDLYKGVLFDVLRKWMPKGNPPDVFIVSAKHGLIPGDRVIDSYEQKMTPERQAELMRQGISAQDLRGKNFNQVYIAGSADYRAVADTYVDRLRKAGFLAPDAPVGATVGGIGEQRGQLGEHLRALEVQPVKEKTPAPIDTPEALAKYDTLNYTAREQFDAAARGEQLGADAAEALQAFRQGKIGMTDFHAELDRIEADRKPLPDQVPDLAGQETKVQIGEMEARPVGDLAELFRATLEQEAEAMGLNEQTPAEGQDLRAMFHSVLEEEAGKMELNHEPVAIDVDQAKLIRQEQKIRNGEPITRADLTDKQLDKAIVNRKAKLHAEWLGLSSEVQYELTRNKDASNPRLNKKRERLAEVEKERHNPTLTEHHLMDAAGKPRRMRWEDLPFNEHRTMPFEGVDKRFIKVHDLLASDDLPAGDRARLEAEKADMDAYYSSRNGGKEPYNVLRTEKLREEGRANARARAERQEVRQPKAKPIGDGIPRSFLKKLKVDHDVYATDEKQWKTENTTADKALVSKREDITNLEAMLKCMQG